jgi:MFS family permease
VLLAVAFVVWESRVRAPMLRMGFFRVRAFSAANAANFAMIGSLYATLFFLAQFFQTAQGDGPLAAGLRLMPWTGTLMVCAPIAGTLADRVGERRFMVVGLLAQTVGMAWIALIATPDLAYGALLPPLVLGGCGISMAMPAAQKAVVGAVAPHEIGQASGAFSMLRQLGGVFGIAIGVAVFAQDGGFASPQAFTNGFAPAIGVAAGLALVGALSAAAMPHQIKARAVVSEPAPVR